MKIVTKQGEDDILKLLSMLKRAKIEMTQDEALQLLMACDRTQKAINASRLPPKITEVKAPDQQGPKVFPIKGDPNKKGKK